MKYDFTSIIDRHGKDAIAVDALGRPGSFAPGAPKEGFDAIPMWVADMNFPTAPSIPEAIIARASHPAYGYFDPSKEYFDAIIDWQRRRNGVTGLKPEHIGYENGAGRPFVGSRSLCGSWGRDPFAQPYLYRFYSQPDGGRLSYRSQSFKAG